MRRDRDWKDPFTDEETEARRAEELMEVAQWKTWATALEAGP